MATTPFLGCKISLISKSEIRYEGILYTIDPKESTIALAKVRSYGTEDRTAERQVPPRDEIFEYIIFRAGDIKDLIVDDPPPTMTGPGLADPAIIQAHSTSTTSAATFPATTFPTSGISTTSGGRSTGPPFNPGTTSGNSVISNLTNPTKTSGSNDSRSRNSTPTNVQQQRPSPTSDWTETGHGRHGPNKENQRRPGGERGAQQYRRGGGQPIERHNFNQNYSGNKRGGGGGGPPRDYRQQNYHQQQSGNRFGGSAPHNRQYNSYPSGGRRPQSRPQSQRGSQNRLSANRPVKEPLKFEEDFDFDKANEDFKEIEEKMSNLKVDGQSTEKPVDEEKPSEQKVADTATNGDKEGVDSDGFYDKTKSFFDTISCEALEREKGNVQRIDWKAERKLNSETFGVPFSHRPRFGWRGRGGYGGYGHRGYSGFRSSRGGYGRGGGGGAGDGRRFNGPAMAHNRT